jgi:hypothetical protein
MDADILCLPRGVAQLAARHVWDVEVGGSSPPTPTCRRDFGLGGIVMLEYSWRPTMPRDKITAVIDSVRYLPDGGIDVVRLYERRGAVWSDLILLPRADLIKRIRKGKITTGSRKPFLGSDLEIGVPVHYEMDIFYTGDQRGKLDLMDGVPVF